MAIRTTEDRMTLVSLVPAVMRWIATRQPPVSGRGLASPWATSVGATNPGRSSAFAAAWNMY